MQQVGFIGPSYTMRSVNVDCQRCVGWYPEINELGTGKDHEIASLVQAPGLKYIDNGINQPGMFARSSNRGMYLSSTGRIFTVVGESLRELSNDPNAFPVGTYCATYAATFAKTSGQVSMTDNGTQLIIVDGIKGYIVDMVASPTVTEFPNTARLDNNIVEITDPEFPAGATTVAFLNQFFIVNRPNSNQFFFSALNDGTSWDGLDFQAKESHPDQLVAVNVQNGLLRLLGRETSELWYNSGDAVNPFARIDGSTVGHGIAAVGSLQNLDGSEIWVSADRDGNSIILMAQGSSLQRISTYPIEEMIRSAGDISAATSWTNQDGGHKFYSLNLPNLNTTLVFDKATGLWHERQSMKYGTPHRFRAEYHVSYNGKHLVGDYQNSSIYELSKDENTDNGEPLIRERTAPHISSNNKRIFYNSFALGVETGVGNTVDPGKDPQIIFDYSNDGGHTYSHEKTASLGKKGEYKKRVMWNSLGSARDRVRRVRVTDPVNVTLISAFDDIEIER